MNPLSSHEWPFVLRPLTPNLGAEIIGIDLAQGVDDEVFRAIYRAFLRYQVLLFAPQRLPPGAQVELRAPLRRSADPRDEPVSRRRFPELYRLSNLDANGKPNGKHPDSGTLAWHTDGSWQRVTGQATIIYGEVVPETAAKRISATCTAPTSASTPRGRRASPACAQSTTSIFRARAATARIR